MPYRRSAVDVTILHTREVLISLACTRSAGRRAASQVCSHTLSINLKTRREMRIAFITINNTTRADLYADDATLSILHRRMPLGRADAISAAFAVASAELLPSTSGVSPRYGFSRFRRCALASAMRAATGRKGRRPLSSSSNYECKHIQYFITFERRDMPIYRTAVPRQLAVTCLLCQKRRNADAEDGMSSTFCRGDIISTNFILLLSALPFVKD